MAYQALYRKYRPSSFTDVIGQQNIVKTIKNSLKIDKISHAYLFSGPRGTGKTTLAKILAKNINCLDLKDGECCNKCDNCLSIINNECSDIIEIDAASNNGVDEIREIKNNVNIVPNQLKYKVYIIDEVHMLSIGAFNALLKTLEEPPSHVIFILATTDLHKVPITIVSRCQCFEFKRIAIDDIVERLKIIVKNENIDIEDNVLYKIADASDGGMRDSISLLDKIRSYTDSKITLDDFYEVNGSLDQSKIEQFVKYVSDGNVIEILNMSDYINSAGKDYIIFCQDVLKFVRNIIVDYYTKSDMDNLDINFLLNFANELNIMINDLKSSSNIKIMFETTFLSLITELQSNKNESNSEINNCSLKNEKLSTKKEQPVDKCDNIIQKNELSKQKNKEDEIKTNYLNIRKNIINNSFVTADKNYLNEVKEKWMKVNDYIFDDELSNIANYLKDTEVRVVGGNEMIISCSSDSALDRGIMLNNGIEKILKMIYNNSYKVAIVTNEEWEKEKNKYIENKKNGISYEYISIDSKEDSDKDDKSINNESSIVQDAIDLFGEDLVKVE